MNTQQFLDKANNLLAIPSTADRPHDLVQALDVVESYVTTRVPGVTVEHFERNGKPSFLAYKGAKRPDAFTVLLNGHVDVVAGKPEQFKPEVTGGKLYGRGALDMKAATLVLADVFCKMVNAVDYPLGLQVVSDEEVGGHDGTLYQIEQGVMANMVVIGEFTPAGSLCTESRGVCWARVHVAGEAAHSAYLWNGTNAVLLAADYARKLLQTYPTPDHDSWQTTVNVAKLATPNTTFNRVPDVATLDLDIRYIAEDDHFADAKSAQAFLEGLMPGARAELLMHEPPHRADPSSPLVRLLAEQLQAQTGQPTAFIRKHGGFDGRFYSARGAPAVAFGLQGEGLHGDDEYLAVDSLDTYHNTLTSYLSSIRQ